LRETSGMASDSNGSRESEDRERLARTLLWIGIGIGAAGLGAAIAFAIVRSVASRRSDDPTGKRIQELIDEANSLLRALDEQRNSA
jgi:hypothetical protein